MLNFRITPNLESKTKNQSCDEQQAIISVKRSVVKIIGDYGTGSGFIIGEDGYVVTNYHVIQNNPNLYVVLEDNESYRVQSYNYDEIVDIALLKITADRQFDVLSWRDSDELSIGADVLAIGYPRIEDLIGEPTVSKGIFSARRHEQDDLFEIIQTDTALNEGNSGSPLIDTCGKVIGVNVGSIVESIGLNFAISSKSAQAYVTALMQEDFITQEEELAVTDSTESYDYPMDAVQRFYDFISTREIEAAYDLLSREYQAQTDYDEWLSGFENTINVFVQDINDTNAKIPSVYVNLISIDYAQDGGLLVNEWEGVWRLIDEDGQWKLDEADIEEVK